MIEILNLVQYCINNTSLDMPTKIDPRAAYVSAVLKELGIPINTDSSDGRVCMQKAVYLAQICGTDLGYHFSGVENAPYSNLLEGTYYLIDEDPSLYEEFFANDQFKKQLAPVKALINAKPSEARLADWLEAIAFLDFKIRTMARPMDQSIERCKTDKPHLSALFEFAKESLIVYGLQQ